MLIGHRGARGHITENTIPSFLHAISLGVDAVELDVHCCKSGELVVVHDAFLERLTGEAVYIHELTLPEVKQLQVLQQYSIPTLDEVVAAVDHRCIINIELKGFATASPVAQACQRYLASGWKANEFIVSSFNFPELKAFQQQLPQIPTGAIYSGMPLAHAQFAEELAVAYLILYDQFLTQAFVDDAHQRGLQVLVFTTNTSQEMNRVKALGVDGIISDYPDRLRIC